MGLKVGELTAYLNVDDTKFNKSMDKAHSSFGSLGSAALKAAAAVGALVVLEKVAGFMREAVEAGMAEQQMFTTLNKVVQNVTGATNEQTKALDDWIGAAQAQYSIAEEELAPAMAKLVAATKDVTKAQDYMAIALDVARGRGVELSSVIMAFSKGAQGTMTAFQRMGISVKDAAGNTKDFKTILAELTQTYGGAAATWANSTAGRFKSLSLRFGELKEAIGQAILPMIEKMLPAIDKFVTGLETAINDAVETGNWSEVGTSIGKAIGDALEASAPEMSKAIGRFLLSAVKGTVSAAAEGLFNVGSKIGEPLWKGFWTSIYRVTGGKAGHSKGYYQLLDDLETAAQSTGKAVKSALWGTEVPFSAYSRTLGITEEQTEALTEAAALLEAHQKALSEAVPPVSNAFLVAQRTIQKFKDEAQKAADVAKDWADALTSGATNIDLGSMWDTAHGSLKRYNEALQEQIANYKTWAAKIGTLKEWFPQIPASVVAKIGEMPGFAQALVKGGKDAAEKTIKGIIEVMALGGDPAAQAWLKDWGTPKAPVKVETTGLSSTWTDIVKWFAGRHITIDTNLGGYAHATGYAAGGPIPGASGQAVPIIAHGREYMLTEGDTDLMRQLIASNNAGGGGGESVSVLNAILTATQQLQQVFRYETDRRIDLQRSVVAR